MPQLLSGVPANSRFFILNMQGDLIYLLKLLYTNYMARHKKKEKQGKNKEERGSRFDISQETKNSIWGIGSFILAV